jgi:phospholipid/cholesterol/gamma-HCH transport system permease protein
VIAPALGQCRRALFEAGPAVVGAAVLASFAALAGDTAAASPAAAWPREAAPLVAALVACGPLAAARAGELARLRLDDQLDALRAMGGSAWHHLVAPRLLAGALVLPLLVLLADAAGLAVAYLDWAPRAARWASPAGVAAGDVALGLVRGALFGAALAAVGCAAGLAPPRPGRGGAARRAPRAVARAVARAGAGGAVAVLGLHVALGGSFSW